MRAYASARQNLNAPICMRHQLPDPFKTLTRRPLLPTSKHSGDAKINELVKSAHRVAQNVERAMDGADFVVQPLKCMTIGMAVALVCCATALGRGDQRVELQRLVQRGFIRAALAILVVNGIFDLAD